MQEQEKEALRTEIYNQIMKDLKEQEKTADLNKQSLNNNVGQAKQKVVFTVMGVSRALWVLIFAPLTVLILYNGISTHTWPITIQLPNVPTPYTNFANVFVSVLVIISVFWSTLLVFSPFRCQCGYDTRSSKRIKSHVEMKHKLKRGREKHLVQPQP